MQDIMITSSDDAYTSLISQMVSLSNYLLTALWMMSPLNNLASLSSSSESAENSVSPQKFSPAASLKQNFNSNYPSCSSGFWGAKTGNHINSINKNKALRALSPLLRFKDGAMPIFYAESKPVILTLMKSREDKLTPVENSLILEEGYLPELPHYTGLTLISLPDNKWVIYNGVDQTLISPEAGASYGFVTMPDHSIRITPSTSSVHIGLSDAFPAVRYAGNLTFDDKNEIAAWDNLSGAYRPDADLAHQAGFHPSDMNKFYSPIAKKNSP